MALPLNAGVYALTSLQIGDIQSYVSRLFLLVACEGLKLVFLVDNGPWTVNSRPSRPAELWQLLVHKSRRSPFANRLRRYSEDDVAGQKGLSRGERSETKKNGWLSLLVALERSCKELAQFRRPVHVLYGCVAFEVSWSDVRGINYSNELQTDTCVSLEVQILTKREFNSLEQAQACYDTILSGPKDIRQTLCACKTAEGKSAGTIPKYEVSGKTLEGFVQDETEASIFNVNNATGVLSFPEALDTRRLGTRHLHRSYSWGSSATIASELTKAYFSSLGSRFGVGLDPIITAGLPSEYFTPPSSPYGGQGLKDLFESYPPCHHKDARKSSIVSLDENLGHSLESDTEGLNLKCANDYTSSAIHESVENVTTSWDRQDVSGAPPNGFEEKKLPGCSKCTLMAGTWTTSTREEAEGSLCCKSNAEVWPDSADVNPDRMITPAETYRDMFILFRFSEPLLPVELHKIITADRRLLKMLESGLPPWVIFLQSYPILCHIYRPWMRPLCGTIYYLISVVTVLIGFYDLYKNVPVLKATAAHICGPLFEWIEEWGMVSRLKYLGTILFLQNCEKAFKWAIAVTRATRQLLLILMRPVIQPLLLFRETVLPLWVGISCGVQALVNIITTTFYCLVVSLSSILSIVIWPFIAFLSTFTNLGRTLLYPVFSAIWTFLSFPLQLARLVGTLLQALSFEAMGGLQNVWCAIHNTAKVLASALPAIQSLKIAKSSTPSPSMWRTLWKDILSKVFHAVNGIVKGLLAFSAACNRHRLSIYNQMVEFFFRGNHMVKSGHRVALTTYRQMFSFADPIVAQDAGDEVETQSDPQHLGHHRSELACGLESRSKED